MLYVDEYTQYSIIVFINKYCFLFGIMYTHKHFLISPRELRFSNITKSIGNDQNKYNGYRIVGCYEKIIF